jgi:hypothetical protein
MTQDPSVSPSLQPALPTSGLAIASLVTGILGFMGPVLFSIIALVTGYAARRETRGMPPNATGDGLATAGIIMGWIQIGLAAAAICVVVAFLLLGIGVWGSLISQ